MLTVSINGRLVEPEHASIPVNDHGFLYGDGVFEGLRFYGKRILKASEHLDRLWDSARAIALTIPVTREAMLISLRDLVTAFPSEDGYIRVIVTRGTGALGIDPVKCESGNLIMIADELSMVSESVREQGAKLIISSTRRMRGDQLDSRIKSLNYLNQILGRLEANAAGADEAVVLNQSGFVAEGTADNLFIVRDGRLLTPPVTDGALDGITRRIILELVEKLSIPVCECSLTPYDLFTADECFLTGTGAELIPVGEIAGRSLKTSPGPVFGTIRQQFQQELASGRLFDDG